MGFAPAVRLRLFATLPFVHRRRLVAKVDDLLIHLGIHLGAWCWASLLVRHSRTVACETGHVNDIPPTVDRTRSAVG